MKSSQLAAAFYAIAESTPSGATVNMCLTGDEENSTITIQQAPSQVLDAITDYGFYLRAQFGEIVVSNEEG